MNNVMDITICIASYNTKEMLLNCIDSIRNSSTKARYEVIVVDNNSADGTVEAFKSSDYNNVSLLENRENRGFACANNQAIKMAAGRYCLLLNSDIIVKPGSIDNLLEFMESHPDAGIAAPKLLNKDGTLQRSCRKFLDLKTAFFLDTLLGKISRGVENKYRMADFAYDRTTEVEQPMGSAALIRTSALNQAGMFDERFFFFFEEVELFYRIKQIGWKIYFVPVAKMFHYRRDDSQITRKQALLRLFYWHQGKYKYLDKYNNRFAVLGLKLFVAFSSLLFIAKSALLFQPKGIKSYWTLIKAGL